MTTEQRHTLGQAVCTVHMVQVPMWVNGQSRGEWSFMAFCSKPGFITDDACNQPITRNTQVLHCSAGIMMLSTSAN